jgi:butyrate kinase
MLQTRMAGAKTARLYNDGRIEVDHLLQIASIGRIENGKVVEVTLGDGDELTFAVSAMRGSLALYRELLGEGGR